MTDATRMDIGEVAFHFYHDGTPYAYDNDMEHLVPIPDNPNANEGGAADIRDIKKNVRANARRYELGGRPAYHNDRIYIADGKIIMK